MSEPSQADGFHARAQAACQQGRLGEGIDYARQALALDPGRARTHVLLGMALAGTGHPQDALASFDRAIALAPDLAAAHGNRGDVLVMLGRQAEAIDSYDRALAIAPASVENWCNRGAALHDLKRYGEALVSYDRAIALKPHFAEVEINRGNALAGLGRHADAVAAYDRALAAGGEQVPLLMSRGIALIELGRRDEALACFERLLAIEPSNVHALNNRGFVLNALDRRDEALASYEHALRLDPKHTEALINRGVALSDLGHYEAALKSYEQALAIAPDHVVALCNCAKALFTLNRFKEALASVERALAINPDHAEALFTRGNVLVRLDRHAEAAACHERVLAINPEHRHARAALANCRMTVCDWPNLARIERDLVERIEQDRLIVSPLVLCGLPISRATFLRAARSYVEHEITRVTPFPRRPTRSGRIKLAYLSADFRRHPVSMLLAELIELHDRERFEVHGVSIGADDRSDIRARMVRAFDHFHDLAGKGDREIARFLYDLGVDIVIDLGGHTDGARPNILAYRAAPIQVSYIGFLGTMGAPFIDYLIADEIVVPRGEDAVYSERVVRLPECFQVNDAQRKIAPRVPSRGDVGLPDDASFVFSCFNANYKIHPPTFDIWMRLLHTVDNSVFWLFRSNDAAAENLRREAAARGIDPARLIFAPRANPEDHLARHALADVFLDTQPINAGATASDALWAGLPIVTSMGDTFLGRVSASLLRAVGLPELVTENRADYEALALRLARDPAMLKAIRQKLADHRLTKPLFDTGRFRRHIEAAYATMVETWQRGEAPRAIDVAPIEGP